MKQGTPPPSRQSRGGKHPARARGKSSKDLSRGDLIRLITKIDASIAQGYRADQTVSMIFKSRPMNEDAKFRLLMASAAWSRFRNLLPESLSIGHRFDIALELASMEPRAALDRLSDINGRTLEARDWLPTWIVQDLPATLDVESLGLALMHASSLWIRSSLPPSDLRRSLGTVLHSLDEHEVLEGCFLAKAKSNLYRSEAFHQGAFVLQDPASQAIGLACAVKPGDHWLDLCAGAGGKTLQLAQAMKGKGLVTACDIHEGRLKELKRRAKRMGVFNLKIVRLEENPPQAASASGYDGVLVDAPCTNSGTLRRNPDLLLRDAPDVQELQDLQLYLLSMGATQVRRGGRLVYATCSLLQAENEIVVQQFLEGNAEFELDPIPDPSKQRVGSQSSWRMTPLESNQDATFVASFRHREHA
jgi:16S rRNA (cytosine967-C5)-methyltransferase